MKRIFIVISTLVCILAVIAGAGYWYLQQLIKSLPLEQLDYELQGFAYKHIHFKNLSFVYHDPSLDLQLRAAVQAQDVFVTWQWHGFTPNLQIVEVASLEAGLSKWPEAKDRNETHINEAPSTEAQDAPNKWLEHSLPDNWRVPDTLPHLMAIDSFSIALPCQQQQCYYSGYLHATSKNKERLLLPDEPQISTLRLAISPHERFQEMQQLDIHLRYEVMQQQPSLALDVQSPGHFQLSVQQHLDSAKRLRTELDSSMQPSMVWLVEHLGQWSPQLNARLEPYVSLWSDALEFELEMQNELPDAPLAEWPTQITGALQAQAVLANQAIAGVQTQLERSPDIDFNGELHLTVLPAFYNNAQHYLHGILPAAQANAFEPYLTQLEQPLRAEGSWRFNLPPGTAPTRWPDSLDGHSAFKVENSNWLAFEDLLRIRPELAGEVHFSHGQLAYIDALARGDMQLEDSAWETAGVPKQLTPGDIRWSLQTQNRTPSDLTQLPFQFALQSQGATDISLHSDLVASLEPEQGWQLRSEEGRLTVRQLHWPGSVELHDIHLDLPFALHLVENDKMQLHSDGIGQGRAAVHASLSDDHSAHLTATTEIDTWQWQVPWQAPEQSSLAASLSVDASDTRITGLQPVDWQWRGDLQLTPLKADGMHGQANGRLTNTAGLSIRHQAALLPTRLQLDWHLSDIFWLAGNPLRQTFDYWPELLSFERGRANASGTLSMPLAEATKDAPQVELRLGLFDTAGIYDTLDFSGANLDLVLDSDLESLRLDVAQANVQRLQYGMPMGPAGLAFSYQGNLQQWLAGQLNGIVQLRHNQLSLLRGTVGVANQDYDLGAPEVRMQVNLTQLDLQQLLSEYPGAEIQGQGLLSGAIPVVWKAGDGFSVEDGRIHALPPGGQIQYRAERARQLSETNQAVRILMDALNDFHYSVLEGGLSYRDDGTLELALTIEGLNPELEGGRPVRLDIRIAEDLPALLASLQLTNQLNEIIQERVQQRLIEALR